MLSLLLRPTGLRETEGGGPFGFRLGLPSGEGGGRDDERRETGREEVRSGRSSSDVGEKKIMT